MESVSDDGNIDLSHQAPIEDISDGMTLFEAGDVIFAKITPCMENGKGAVVPRMQTKFGFGSTEFHVLRPRGVDGKFLYYVTYNPVFRGYAAANMFGAAGQKRVSGRFLKDTPIFLPGLQEQRQIADYLDKSCATLDAAVAAKREQLRMLSLLRASIIQRATMGQVSQTALVETRNDWLRKLPNGWGLKQLKRVASIQGGLTLGQHYEGKLIRRPYLRVANVQDGHLDLEDITYVDLPLSAAARVALRKGDVLMTEGGDLDKLGRGYLWSGEIESCLHQNHIFAVRCQPERLLPSFLAYVTSSPYGRDYFEATGKRTTNLASTNKTKVGEFPVPLPSIDEQRRICTYLDDKLNVVATVTASIESQIGTLGEYRSSLIHECVTGQRRIMEDDSRPFSA